MTAIGDEEGVCGRCGGPLRWKQAYPFPVIEQALFAGSFILYLLFGDRLFAGGAHRPWLWFWCVVQVALGVWLVRQRLRAKKRVLRCIRCGQALTSKH